jgi:hypothetical protein
MNTLLPFSMRTSGTSVKPEHPSFHFGTFHKKVLHKISFYFCPKFAIFSVFQNSFVELLFSSNFGTLNHPQGTQKSLSSTQTTTSAPAATKLLHGGEHKSEG